MTAKTIDDARAAKAAALERFAQLGEVVGVGITRVGEGFGLKVNLRHAPAQGVELPHEVAGVPVRVEVVGEIRKRRLA